MTSVIQCVIIYVRGDFMISKQRDIDWYLQDYETPNDGWEHIEPEGREVW